MTSYYGKSYERFEDNLKSLETSKALVNFIGNANININCTDLWRWQWVQLVSAMDKFLHDFILEGVRLRIETNRLTPKLESLDIPLKFMKKSAETEFQYDSYIAEKLSHYSYQSSKNIADGLALVWGENQKWSMIEVAANQDLRTPIDLISTRRNQIVHQSDFPFEGSARQTLTQQEINNCEMIIACTVKTICKLVSSELFELRNSVSGTAT